MLWVGTNIGSLPDVSRTNAALSPITGSALIYTVWQGNHVWVWNRGDKNTTVHLNRRSLWLVTTIRDRRHRKSNSKEDANDYQSNFPGSISIFRDTIWCCTDAIYTTLPSILTICVSVATTWSTAFVIVVLISFTTKIVSTTIAIILAFVIVGSIHLKHRFYQQGSTKEQKSKRDFESKHR